MALVKWRPRRELGPWRALHDLEDEMERMVGWRGWPLMRREAETLQEAWAPDVDVVETEDKIVVKADVPGLTKEDFDISIVDNFLTIKGERKKESEVKEENYHRVERFYGAFERSFRLPATVQLDKIEASYKDGVLEVVAPKKAEAKAKKKAVKIK